MKEKTEEKEKKENKNAQEESSKAEETSSEEKKADEASEASESSDAQDEKKEEASKTPEERIAELENEIEEMKKAALYKAAENDNWRKNMLKQREDAIAYANENLLKDLLDSLDNFDRTVEAADTAKDAKAIADGVRMISKSLVSLLENKYNLVAFGKEGDDFDPDLHEAIGMQQGDVKKEQLAAVYLKGYKLKDRVIRHAKVMVVKPAE